MIQSDFKDKHKGEEMIVICNGSGLKNIPFAFLESRPSFAINFFPYWVPWIKPTYWSVTDPRCFEVISHEALRGVPKFVPEYTLLFGEDENPEKAEGYDAVKDEVVYYQYHEDIPRILNVKRGKGTGLRFGTTAIACAHHCWYMGASAVLLVGFDCTLGLVEYEGEGLSKIPHFYDARNHKGEYAESWDKDFGSYATWASENGMEVVNLSVPTMSTTLIRSDLRGWWRP